MKKGVAIILAVLVADQLSKLWIADLFAEGRRVIEITSFFNIVEVWNPGVSFGMGAALGPWVLTGLAVVISVALFIWLLRAETGLLQIALSLLIGGAVGNVIDRVRFGAVYDFLDVHVMGYHWPAFNVADSAITVGAVMLLFDSLFGKPESPKK
jgi:signal peptidase II